MFIVEINLTQLQIIKYYSLMFKVKSSNVNYTNSFKYSRKNFILHIFDLFLNILFLIVSRFQIYIYKYKYIIFIYRISYT